MDFVNKRPHAASSLLLQFTKYAFVGGIAAAIDISVFYTAANILGINHIVSNTLSFVMGLIFNYYASSKWVFNKQNRSLLRDFVVFSVIGLLGLLLSNLILYVLVDWNILHTLLPFLSAGTIKLIAKLNAVAIVLFWNFAARKKLVFSTT